ncbi:MAG: DNA translocase FtsK 4TM domain-containing protein [Sutterellaceae bacterium]|nr:DNA translocase FtsK 4TM domain-containing protein [Burkholderiaceae bacterium]MDW8430934.1 DNA translocase FtsK 4TM domain-containing protein [Sutterellaceae bacterium]
MASRFPADRSPLSRVQQTAAPSRLRRLLLEAVYFLGALAVLALATFLATFDRNDPGFSHAVSGGAIRNAGGPLGAWIADVLLLLFGWSAWLWVIAAAAWVARGLRRLHAPYADHGLPDWVQAVGLLLLIVSTSGIEALRLQSISAALPGAAGGVLGSLLAPGLEAGLGNTAATVLLIVLLAIGASLFFDFSWLAVAERLGTVVEAGIVRLRSAREEKVDRAIGEAEARQREKRVAQERERIEEAPPVHIERPAPRVAESARKQKEKQVPLFAELADGKLPTLDLLDEPGPNIEAVSTETLEFTSRLIEKKLKDFGVEVTVVAAYPGPVITRYEIEPAVGVKGSQIVNLAKDLARALSLTSIRVVETIPGKNLMGLELPNPKRQVVRLSEILGSAAYHESPSPITLALGKDIAGKPVVVDLARLPHLLVAGTTGSGKSVGINAMILSLLYKADASQVRLLLIDPKMLELSVYEGIPHLLAPIVTDMREAGHALNWCVAEMDRRYRLMSKLGVRSLAGYNQKLAEARARGQSVPNPFSLTPESAEPLEPLPLIVVVIDELADLMMVTGKKVEELIARIAQKARAAGMHLILATQRPSVDVITGLIKANIPARIAFQVASKVDSRTILDQIGAETLLGAGDMLYLAPGTGLPVRVHGAFVADAEVHRVVDFLKSRGAPQYVEGVLDAPEPALPGAGGGERGGEADPLYDEAVQIVLKNRRASISLVQRHLRIGYNRAARLLEDMERAGLVSPMQPNGNREILVPHREG